MRLLLRILTLFLLVITLFSCRKDKFIDDPGAKLDFSQDSILFDTVFTTVGSTTKRFKVYNPHQQPIRVDKIYLGKGNSSNFRLNVDGIPGRSFEEIDIPAEDSIYVFVEVTVDPTNQNSPLVIHDSIVFETNNNIQRVMLEAWGQDAYYHKPNVFPTNGFPPYSIIVPVGVNQVWTNDKPHVIYGYAVVDSAASLTIASGTQVHFHKNAGLWIYRFGSLKVNGQPGNPVVFQGDRLEPEYRDIPGQWDRIWINQGAVDNEINYAVIKNGFIGIQAERFLILDGTNKLKMNGVRIENMSGMGIYAINYNIEGYNNLVHNCATYTFAGTLGGGYRFDHCTFANYWDEETRDIPSILISNRNEVQDLDLDSAFFNNCILTGDLDNELELDSTGGSLFNYRFHKSIIKTTGSTANASHYSQVLNGADPMFNDIGTGNFHLNSISSPAANSGDPLIIRPFDLDGEGRPQGPAPDLGCYEDWGF
jgi:hypothetical protein